MSGRTNNEYRRRMVRCMMAALAVHLVLLAVPAGCPRNAQGIGAATVEEEPLRLTLREAKDKPLRLIESGAPADVPVNPETDLISERNSKAQDLSDVEGTRPAPHVPTPAESDELRMPDPSPEPSAQVAPQPQPSAEKAAVEPEPQESTPEEESIQAVEEPSPQEPEPVPEAAEPERMQMAKADPQDMPTEEGQTRGRVDGGVKGQGFLSFEAMESEFAPYLREVRGRVERRWKALIQLRYSGSSATRAVIDCAIDSDGRLVHVSVVEPGDSASYAGLCKEAIEKAGPFPPFPFKVPEVYRNKDLEIRWTFSFL